MSKWILLLGLLLGGQGFCAPNKLDVRFTQALTQMNQKLDASKALWLEKGQGGYQLKHHNQLIYQMNDSSFYSLFEALKASAHFLLNTENTPPKRRELSLFENTPFSPAELIDGAIKSNKQAINDKESLKKLNQNLILLNFFTYDELDEMDEYKANSWMLLALYEAKFGVRDDVLLAMLAQNLGYELFAEHLMLKVPKHPLHNFYQSEPIIGESNFAALLRVKKAVLTYDTKRWRSAIDALAEKSIAPSLIFYHIRAIDTHNVRSKLLLLYPLIIFNDYQDSKALKKTLFNKGSLDLSIDNTTEVASLLAKNLPYKPSQLIAKFEKQITDKGKVEQNGLLTETIFINYWQSQIFNAYYSMAVYLAQIEQNERLANDLLEIFKSNVNSQIGLMLYSWYQVLVLDDAYQKAVDKFILISQSNTPSLALLQALYDRQYYLKPSKNNHYIESHNILLGMLDSRYQHQTQRFKLEAEFDQKSAKDIVLAEYNYQINDDLIVGLDYLASIDLLYTALELTAQANEQALILGLIFKHGSGSSTELARLAKLYKDNSESFYILKQYIDVLLSYSHQAKQATLVLDTWIVQKRDLSRRDYLELIALIARARLVLGDTNNAWNAIVPTLSYNYPTTMLIAADILLAQKKIKQTNEIIAEYKRKLPNTIESLAYQLKSLWLQGKLAAAADLVVNWYFPLDDKQFKTYIVDNLRSMKLSKQVNQTFISHLEKIGLAESHLKSIKALGLPD